MLTSCTEGEVRGEGGGEGGRRAGVRCTSVQVHKTAGATGTLTTPSPTPEGSCCHLATVLVCL